MLLFNVDFKRGKGQTCGCIGIEVYGIVLPGMSHAMWTADRGADHDLVSPGSGSGIDKAAVSATDLEFVEFSSLQGLVKGQGDEVIIGCDRHHFRHEFHLLVIQHQTVEAETDAFGELLLTQRMDVDGLAEVDG